MIQRSCNHLCASEVSFYLFGLCASVLLVESWSIFYNTAGGESIVSTVASPVSTRLARVVYENHFQHLPPACYLLSAILAATYRDHLQAVFVGAMHVMLWLSLLVSLIGGAGVVVYIN
jgi:hypothetical protein